MNTKMIIMGLTGLLLTMQSVFAEDTSQKFEREAFGIPKYSEMSDNEKSNEEIAEEDAKAFAEKRLEVDGDNKKERKLYDDMSEEFMHWRKQNNYIYFKIVKIYDNILSRKYYKQTQKKWISVEVPFCLGHNWGRDYIKHEKDKRWLEAARDTYKGCLPVWTSDCCNLYKLGFYVGSYGTPLF